MRYFCYSILPPELQYLILDQVYYWDAKYLFQTNKTLRNFYLRRGSLLLKRINEISLESNDECLISEERGEQLTVVMKPGGCRYFRLYHIPNNNRLLSSIRSCRNLKISKASNQANFYQKNLRICENLFLDEFPHSLKLFADAFYQNYFISIPFDRLREFQEKVNDVLKDGIPGRNPKASLLVKMSISQRNQTAKKLFDEIASNLKKHSNIQWMNAALGEMRTINEIEFQLADILFEGSLLEFRELQPFLIFEKSFDKIKNRFLKFEKEPIWKVFLSRRIDENKELAIVLRFTENEAQLFAKVLERRE
ncbi:unnamed protein product, partial [Mesorhabditis belari]|uniref:F-box domain-containing protein n=1 Tax=Mesorhabditis belari TaxID=2138241 RepID=A0AAF3FIG1_9BILA